MTVPHIEDNGMDRVPARTIDDLKAFGYGVSLEGDNIRLRYLGVGTQPPEAGPLIEELKANKAGALEYLKAEQPLPTLDENGVLDRLPFGSDVRFHYWAGGQRITETEKEIRQWVH